MDENSEGELRESKRERERAERPKVSPRSMPLVRSAEEMGLEKEHQRVRRA